MVPIGTNRYKDISLPYSIKKIRVNCDSFKTLGVWFSQDQNKAVRLDYDCKIKKIDTILNIWRGRNLSWKGKILILKSLVIPQIQYLLSSCYCPYSYLKKIDTLLFSFLWNSKTSKIKRNSVCATYSMGG